MVNFTLCSCRGAKSTPPPPLSKKSNQIRLHIYNWQKFGWKCFFSHYKISFGLYQISYSSLQYIKYRNLFQISWRRSQQGSTYELGLFMKRTSEYEFNVFEQCLVQLSAGLNLETLNTILSGTNHIWAASQI